MFFAVRCDGDCSWKWVRLDQRVATVISRWLRGFARSHSLRGGATLAADSVRVFFRTSAQGVVHSPADVFEQSLA